MKTLRIYSLNNGISNTPYHLKHLINPINSCLLIKDPSRTPQLSLSFGELSGDSYHLCICDMDLKVAFPVQSESGTSVKSWCKEEQRWTF